MNIETIINYFHNKGFEVFNIDNFVEFKGNNTNESGNTFEVEGSFELSDNKLDYSVNVYDVDNDRECDGMVGTINNPSVDDVNNVLSVDFVVIG